jgi:D-3-phosphoglycerate dehydrogenase
MAEIVAPAQLVLYDVVPATSDVVGLIIAPEARLDKGHVDLLPRLRVVAAPSTGVDHIDIGAVTARGAWVTSVPDYCTEEVADHALAHILSLLRGVGQADRAVRRGDWAGPSGVSRTAGTELGLVGFGRIGQAVAGRAGALGMSVSAFDPHVGSEQFARRSVRKVEQLPSLLGGSDVVSLHVPLNEGTVGLIGAAAFAAMRPGSWLVNVSRGGVVDQQALVEVLRSGRLAGAGLDVFEHEPLARDDPLLSLDNVTLTPHTAWESAEARRVPFVRAAEAVAAVLGGAVPADVVAAAR